MRKPNVYNPEDDLLLRAALKVAEKRLKYEGVSLESPQAVRDFLHLRIAASEQKERESELFGVIWLTTKHQVISTEVLFHGSIDSASVYPREVVKAGLKHNAAACIVFHNHPSGDSEPSQADRMLTVKLKEALALVDIRLLDHLVVGHKVTSLAELGWV